jgi:hypothetical protein
VELLLDAVAGGTRVTVIESGLASEDASPLLAAGWAQRLRALRIFLGRVVLA